MPKKKTISHKILVRNLLASKKLSKPEQTAFQKMAKAVGEGEELSGHQKLWVEALHEKYSQK